METVLPYLQMFCRMVIGLTFAISCVGKLRQFSSFQLTIIKFSLVPQRYVGVVARLFVAGEGMVALLLLGGGLLIGIGLGLALGLLILFTAALTSVLVRHIKVACQCFGTADKDVSPVDLWRNAGLILCAVIGFATTFLVASSSALPFTASTLLALMAIAFVTVWIQLHEVVQLFQ